MRRCWRPSQRPTRATFTASGWWCGRYSRGKYLGRNKLCLGISTSVSLCVESALRFPRIPRQISHRCCTAAGPRSPRNARRSKHSSWNYVGIVRPTVQAAKSRSQLVSGMFLLLAHAHMDGGFYVCSADVATGPRLKKVIDVFFTTCRPSRLSIFHELS